MNKNDIQQIPISFSHKTLYEKQDFMISKSNIEAIRVVEEWPNWPTFAICIYGSEGCGKTHIAHIFMDNVYRKTNHPYKIPHVMAKDIKNENIHEFFKQNKCIVVENLDEDIDEEAMFHLYNLYKNNGGFILFTARKAPARISFELADLKSRLNSIPAIEISEPDSELLSVLIVKLFSDRQLIVSQDIISYISNNAQRSFMYIKKLIAEIDAISISKKRAISIPIIKEAISILDDDKQGILL